MKTCPKCKCEFLEGDKIRFTGMSVYHIVPVVKGQELRFAVERPSVVTNVEHWLCNEHE